VTGTEHRLTTLESGIRIVTEAMASVRSVALGLWIGTGSRGETEPESGLSHFLEHLLFKGSDRYASHEIDEIFDGMGAELNAGTGKETTSVYARFLDQHLDRALDIASDMVWRPAFRDVDAEREVVIEEIAMYEDDPQDHVFDILGSAIFGEHPLGRPIIGRRDVVGGTPVEAIASFHAARYVPGNVVVAAAGSIDHDRLVELVSTRLPDRDGNAPQPEPAPVELRPSTRMRVKETEQYHVCLGAPGVARGDDRRFALRILDALFGGTSSSRLFQEVREKRGLAYAVSSFTGQYADTGQVGLYLGTRPDNLGEALRVVAAELERIRSEPVSEAELHRAREHAKGRLVLSLESTSARMNRLGSSVLTGVPLLSVEESIARFEEVTAGDVQALARELLDAERISAAGVGPDEDAFRAALEPLGGGLAAAAPVGASEP
jgi:predicted Zn-dependent peptidase